jgi:sodium/proline symporter
MSETTYQLIAIGVYFALMIAIGFYAYTRTRNIDGYMLAERGLHPAVAALSANAADMSGWLLMGLPGAIYASGLIESWIAIGLTIGAWLNWKFVAPRLRAYTEIAGDSITIPSFFENRTKDKTRLLRVVSAIIILVFFTLYVSSGMVAGGKFFVSSFDGGSYVVGMLLVTAVTLSYTLFGGFLGASLTDVVQGIMLCVAVLVVPVAAVIAVGGWGEAVSLITTINPNQFDFFGGTGLTSATLIGILSGLAWGLGYFGQPHIIVRFMALRTPQAAKTARRIGVGWQVLSLTGAVFAGLIGVAFIQKEGISLADPELILLTMAQTLLHPLLAGLVLAAVLAAIMSTFSSQLIVCSSALVEDLYKVLKKTPPSEKRLVLLGRLCVLAVAIVAMLLAINPNDTVLGLVSFAWAGFGAAFGPIVLLSLYWRKLSNWGALAGMVVGTVTVFAWGAMEGGWFDLYELLPGFVFALIAAVVVSLATYKPNADIDREFTETGTMVVVK